MALRTNILTSPALAWLFDSVEHTRRRPDHLAQSTDAHPVFASRMHKNSELRCGNQCSKLLVLLRGGRDIGSPALIEAAPICPSAGHQSPSLCRNGAGSHEGLAMMPSCANAATGRFHAWAAISSHVPVNSPKQRYSTGSIPKKLRRRTALCHRRQRCYLLRLGSLNQPRLTTVIAIANLARPRHIGRPARP